MSCHCSDVCNTKVRWYESPQVDALGNRYIIHYDACLFMCEDADCTPVLINRECITMFHIIFPIIYVRRVRLITHQV